jgi:hypothetical protein
VRESQEIHYSTVAKLNSAHFPDPPSHLGPRTVFHIQRIWGEEYRDVATNVGLNNRHRSSEFLCKTYPNDADKMKSPKVSVTLPTSLISPSSLTPKSSDRKPLQSTGKKNRRHRHHPKPKQGEKKNRKRKRFHERSQSRKQEEEEDSLKNQLPMTGSTLRQTLRNGLVSISPSGDFTVFIVSKAGPKTVVVVVSIAEGGRGRERERGENREIQ